MIWALRMILDINEVLGDDCPRPHHEMRETVNHALKILDFQIPGPDGVAQPGGGGERWLRKDEEVCLITYDLCKPIRTNHELFVGDRKIVLDSDARDPLHSVFTSRDSIPAEYRSRYEDRLSKGLGDLFLTKPPNMVNYVASRDAQFIRPNDEPLFIFTHNPLYCGTRAFQILVHMEHAGMTLASHHHTILSIAHHANALRKLDKLELRWEDLDRVIKLQMGPLFGSTLPSTPQQIQTNLMLRLGYSSRTWARDQKSLSTRHLPKYNLKKILGPQLTGDPVAAIF